MTTFLDVALALALVTAAAFGFWRLTRYFWLKRYYRWRGVRDIDVADALRRYQRAGQPIIDVREPSEYAAAHIEGVPLIPLGQLLDRLDELRPYQQQEILIICRGGVRSAKACLILASHGFAQPLNIAGGMSAWQAQGLPAVEGPTAK